ncbi:MAG: S9 family peptidase [Asgard group archaeon]|nr:S9 family peptidase [Asgard group archaeon]
MSKNLIKNYKPTIDDFINLPKVASGILNPMGNKIAYLLIIDDLKQNNMIIKCNIIDTETNQIKSLTETGMSLNLTWLNDNDLALRRLQPSSSNGFQILVYENLESKGIQITDHPGGISYFKKFNNGFIFLAKDNNKVKEINDSKFGNYIHFEEEPSTSAIYYVDYKTKIYDKESVADSTEIKSKLNTPVINLTELFDRPYSIKSFKLSEKTNSIYLNCSSKDDLYYEEDTFCFKIDLDTETMINEYLTSPEKFKLSNYAKISKINLPKGAIIEEISPDGKKLLISYKERELKQYILSDLFLLDITKINDIMDQKQIKDQFICITRNFDRKPLNIVWSQAGIFVSYANESVYEIAKISETGEVEKLDFGSIFPRYYFSVTDSGIIAFNGLSDKTQKEIYYGKPKGNTKYQLVKLTNHTDYTNDWEFGSIESIRWKSRDGLEIQGIIRKPIDFNPNKKYPLLFLNHGGPSGNSYFAMVEDEELYNFPTIQLCNKGVIIAKVNYRGSIGKGQKFHEIGVDNVGIGDQWDIESCIDYLISLGFIDETKIGSLGWSQGGFISAFLGMHSKRFTAVSVGAGVSSWYTYFVTSDLRNSLNISGHPFEPGKMEIYQKTAPISGIKEANTPMLLLHGENDQRIGLASAMELYRALKEKGVPTELFIFRGKGHGLDTPKENYACMMLNYQWFAHYLLGEELVLHK